MIDLYCGLGGWASGGIAEGYRVVGFDIERHEYWVPEADLTIDDGSKGTGHVPKRGMTQGCAVSLGLEGATAKPRTRLMKYPAQLVLQDILTLHGKQFKDAALIVASPPCQEYSYMAMPWSRAKAIAAEYRSGVRDVKNLTALLDACFRIQREAIEAAGHFIPLVVENVRGACPWVGRSRWNFGSFHLWGDVPALMPMTRSGRKLPGNNAPRLWVDREVQRLCDATKTPGRSLSKGTDRKFGTHNMGSAEKIYEELGIKVTDDGRKGFAARLGESDHAKTGSKSKARKAASAMIAKIPLTLSRYIAAHYKPTEAA